MAIPSFYDGMPNVLLEAMALGVPIVAAQVAGMADVLSAENDFLSGAGQRESCSNALQKFTETDKIQLKIMSKTLVKK